MDERTSLIVHIDGASKGNPGPAGIGVLIRRGDETVSEVSEFIGQTTNNVAEYRALIRALEISLGMSVRRVSVRSDSELLVRQMKRIYRVNSASLLPLFQRADALARKFESCRIQHVDRSSNQEADRLANQAIQQEKKVEEEPRFSSASQRRIEEALRALREKDVRSTTLERIRLAWEADAFIRDLPQPLQLGEGIYYLLDRIAVPVSPDDLVLGRIIEEVPDHNGEVFLRRVADQWGGRSIPPWMRDGGHECLAWERLLRLGLPGLEEFARQERARRIAAGETGGHMDFLLGAVRVYQAFRNYARRYARAAWTVGLDEVAQCCAVLAERPPETFAEALQLLWLVAHVYCTMVAQNPTLTFGRTDELLLDFYRADLAAGRLTRDEAGVLIEDFYCKNNLILGRGEHQMSGGSEKSTGWFRNLCYDAPQYLILGGCREDGSATTNELTELFLERMVPRFENPVVVLRYTSDLSDPLWQLTCDRMRANATLLVYNDHDVIPAMVHCGISERDAVTYTMHGCNWPDIPGKERNTLTYRAVLPHHFLHTLLGADGEPPSHIESIDEVYERFAASFRAELGEHCDRFRTSRAHWDEQAPGPLRIDDCFLEGPVARARDWQLGGTPYTTMTCSISAIATTGDCFAALDDLVFVAKQVPLETLREALRRDFAGQEALRQRCLHAPKFGQDDDRADRHTVRVLKTILEEIDRASRLGSPDEIPIFRCLTMDMVHMRFGAEIGATPDGRRAGRPISENTSPQPGSCTKGITAMFRSIAKLPLDRINSGALNVRIQPRMVAGEDGLERLSALLRTYFDMGGLQIQLSFADTEELRDAQVHPERHRDLMIRITGYSAVFTDMDKAAQDEIIRREEMGN